MATLDLISIGIVDDHRLFRKGLISLIEIINPTYSITFEADNGIDLQKKLSTCTAPSIILMDVSMPGMDGFESVKWLQENYPNIHILIVSMIEKEETIVKMLKLGVKGYVCKDVEPKELAEALHAIANKGYYYTDFITGKLVHSLRNDKDITPSGQREQINEREKKFLELACSELTYHEIADQMFLSPKTIDGYRNSLFEKLNVKSRVGLVLYAIRNKLVSMDWVIE